MIGGLQMRKVKRGIVNEAVLTAIARNYKELQRICGYRRYGLFCSKSYEDIFQDTILFVSQDEKASSLVTDNEIIEYFQYRFKMIEYQAIQDNKQLREIPYANYLQATETTREE